MKCKTGLLQKNRLFKGQVEIKFSFFTSGILGYHNRCVSIGKLIFELAAVYYPVALFVDCGVLTLGWLMCTFPLHVLIVATQMRLK